jgi:hypothetical protein
VKCGLRKGSIKENFRWHETVYFDSEKLLNTGKLPFPCGDEWIGGELLINSNDVIEQEFICEDEFKV